MKSLLEKAGLSFLRAFGASVLVLSVGVLSAPNLNQSYALGVAALVASLAAGFKALQVLVPGVTFAAFVSQPWAAWTDSFTRAFLGAFIIGILGVLNAPDFATGKALAVAAIIGAVTAGVRALQGFVSAGESPAPSVGV